LEKLPRLSERQLRVPLNKEVLLTQKKDGIVSFKVPSLEQTSEVRLRFVINSFISRRHSILKKRGAFFNDLFKKGFVQNGAIYIDGLSNLPLEDKTDHPDFRTVIQVDGDIICKINQNILEEKNIQGLLRGYGVVRHQFIEAFEAALRIRRERILVIIGIIVSILIFILYI
jgi:hypothetical protein